MSHPLWEGVREGCGTCRFARQVGTGPYFTCHRRPPVLLPMVSVDPWGKQIGIVERHRPTMPEDDWCGEYERSTTCAS